MLVFAAITPHPPVSIPEIGNQDEIEKLKKTINAFDILRAGLEHARPDVIVIISPHAAIEPYSFVINSESNLKGNLIQFGLDHVMEFKNDIEIAEVLAYACHFNEIPAHLHPQLLDHGALIPLYHLTKNIHPHVVHLAFSLLDFQVHCRYGEVLSKICSESPKRIAIIASGDLSHRLLPNAPAGYSKRAKFFDQQVIENFGRKDLTSMMNLHRDYIEEAAECGLRSFIILMCSLYRENYTFDMLSYEGPFGVGYLTARLL